MYSDTDTERLDWLQLIRTEHIGAKTFRQLLQLYGSAKAALSHLPTLSSYGGRKLIPYSRKEAEKELEELRASGGDILLLGEKAYPSLLASLEDAPPVLSYRGILTYLTAKPIVAMVGTRHATANGYRLAACMAEELGQKGYVIASGLARGIDTACHQGALATGTIGVIAAGMDNVYPPENKELYQHMVEKGIILSEYALGMPPKPQHFPQRNRIIAGLAYATVVVEASLHSGSLITARFALEQGREVCAVPGSPLEARSRGANALLRDGAYLVQSAEDIHQVVERVVHKPLGFSEHTVPPFSGPPQAIPSYEEIAKAKPYVLEKLSVTPVAVEDIVAQTGLMPQVVLAVLLALECAGKLIRQPNNKVMLLSETV